MLNQAVLVLIVTSFVIVTLIFSLYSVPDVFARIKYGNIICIAGVGPKGATVGEVGCCQTQTDTTNGLEIKYCTICADTQPPSQCGPRFSVRGSSQGSLSPVGNTTIAPSTGKFPPGSIIKASPGTLNTLTSTGNNTNSSIARAAGVYSPTGYCVRSNHVTCTPCDPGLPGGKDTCIPSGEWPPSASLPLTGNNTSTITKLPPGAFKPTGNLTNSPTGPLLAKQPTSSGHQHHKGSTSSTGNTNSTGH